MDSIGFVLITHGAPAQIIRLIKALSALYSNPPIAIHHDFDRCPLDVSSFQNVKVVRPHFRTQWCGYSVVEATLACVALLYESRNPDWFAVLSGACYPTKIGGDVVTDLKKGDYDAYIDHKLIDPFHLETDYQRECFRRYYSLHFGLKKLDRRMTPVKIAELNAPYKMHNHRCYAGSEWFTANRAVAKHIISSQQKYSWLASHLEKRHCPDETYFQTVVCNASQFKLSNNNHRYIDWSSHLPHPKELDLEDLPAILQSSSHFARKFAADSAVLDRLDVLLGIESQP